MTTVEILKKAKADIIARGWTQAPDDDATTTGQTCAAIAINFAGSDETERAYDLMAKVIGLSKEEADSNWRWMADWNDAPDRTHDEVLATFDRAIALAEQEAADAG